MFKEHVATLSITDLRLALRSAGLQSGPITASTEAVYRAALYKYLMGNEDCETEPTSPLNSSNSDVEYVESGSASDVDADLELDEACMLHAEPLRADTLESSKAQFTPIRWNEKYQRYETIYGENNGPRKRESDDGSPKGVRKWLLLIGIACVFIAIVIGTVFLSGDRDPYKGLEDAASRLAKPHGKVPLNNL